MDFRKNHSRVTPGAGRAPRLTLACAAFWLLALPAPAQNGIFADFTTSFGPFTCVLDYTNAPRAVANFIGLATGQKAWVNPLTGAATTNRFYDGLTFHRVIADFMIQGGSRNGQGTDGPGYVFPDETSPARPFNAFGLLAMANTGTNSNGAQFFVTAAPTTWLNNLHTIFGRVTSGSNVVYAISRVATSGLPDNKPLTNVVVESVAIRRAGAAAQAFDIEAQGLPTVANPPARIAPGSGGVGLSFSNVQYAANSVWFATNLPGPWTESQLGIEIAPPAPPLLEDNTTAPQRFYRVTQVLYPHSTLAPKDVHGRALALTLTEGGSGTINIAFNSSGGGTFVFGTASGAVQFYDWDQEPYRAMAWLALTGFPVLQLKLDFVGAASGRFSGTAYPAYPIQAGAFGVAGTFVLP